eukprot:bmy_07619T0
MGILFTRIWRLCNHQAHKVIIVGLDNAGKTTILYQCSMNEVVHNVPNNRNIRKSKILHLGRQQLLKKTDDQLESEYKNSFSKMIDPERNCLGIFRELQEGRGISVTISGFKKRVVKHLVEEAFFTRETAPAAGQTPLVNINTRGSPGKSEVGLRQRSGSVMQQRWVRKGHIYADTEGL